MSPVRRSGPRATFASFACSDDCRGPETPGTASAESKKLVRPFVPFRHTSASQKQSPIDDVQFFAYSATAYGSLPTPVTVVTTVRVFRSMIQTVPLGANAVRGPPEPRPSVMPFVSRKYSHAGFGESSGTGDGGP
jgi:hypothetical protein